MDDEFTQDELVFLLNLVRAFPLQANLEMIDDPNNKQLAALRAIRGKLSLKLLKLNPEPVPAAPPEPRKRRRH